VWLTSALLLPIGDCFYWRILWIKLEGQGHKDKSSHMTKKKFRLRFYGYMYLHSFGIVRGSTKSDTTILKSVGYLSSSTSRSKYQNAENVTTRCSVKKTLRTRFFHENFRCSTKETRTAHAAGYTGDHEWRKLLPFVARRNAVTESTRNAWQSLAYSPLGAIVSPPSEYLLKTLTYW